MSGKEKRGCINCRGTSSVKLKVLKIILLFSPLVYLFLWNVIIRYDLISMWKGASQVVSGVLGNEVTVQASTSVEVIHWRMRVIPLYWSKIGELTFFHNVFATAYFFYVLFLIYKVVVTRKLQIPKRKGKNRKEKFSFGSLKKLESFKKYWMLYGILAFLTTTLSFYPSFIFDLFSLIYFVAYVTSIVVAFIMVIWFLQKT